MMKINWTERNVMACLEDAADIHRRLPEVKVQGYYNLWPETFKDDWQRYYDLANGKSRMGAPMPSEVTYHEGIMSWLRWLDPYHQQVVWLRANRLPWKMLQEVYGKSRSTLHRDVKGGLALIAGRLSTNEVRLIATDEDI